MSHRDDYYNRAKQEGYRARSAYKLRQLDDEFDLLSPGDVVVDLGAAPGGWLQVAAERGAGTVIGVDRQRIDPLEDGPGADGDLEVIRGDITDESTRETIRERVSASTDRPIDVVLSDMAPNMTGEYEVDHARSVHLARQAVAVAEDVLAGGGNLVVKVFEGPDVEGLRMDLEREFDHVRLTSPDASRDASSEIYLVATGRLTAPVRAGEEIEVDIVDEGSEGDGVATVEGFTLFVPGAAVGETVRVRIEEVAPRFGRAERLD